MAINISPEITAAVGVVSAAAAWLIRGTRTWTNKEKDLEAVSKGHESLRQKFDDHERRSDIHIDPRRDAASVQGLRDMISDSFQMVYERLDKIDSRCEKRGEVCANHFSHVEQRISAISGKTNGEGK